MWHCRVVVVLGLTLVVFLCHPVKVYSDNLIDQDTLAIFKRGVLDGGTPCYDETGRAQRCIPEFENAAFGKLVEATNTCGQNGPTEFCVQTSQGPRKSCQYCSYSDHPPSYLTDLNSNQNQTWWQSETMFEEIQHPTQVNLTLYLGKAYDITYVRLMFHTQRPESFVIYKRLTEDSPWIPFQFYSATCRDTYGLPDTDFARRNEEARALCTAEYSDISPLTGGNVAFSTLEGRPSASKFDTSAELQEWVTATDIRITLDRLNTFGDEVFGDSQVLKSYFYAISDFAVGARCKCNGHASECVPSRSADGTIGKKACVCQHYTAGPDCNECRPFYNDAPWGRASALDAHECKPCNCNGFSNRCFFDKDLYEMTGHGGHCLDCTGNRDGPNCERCKDNYYQREDNYCVPCQCDETGSRSLQCNSEGRCQCKPGVTGEKCDRCDINYYDFGPQGCKECGCHPPGSINNEPDCNSHTGDCKCKDNVEGKRCRTCKPGYFNMDNDNEFGCTPCFCYGHSSVCHSAPGYSKVSIESMFGRHNERWTAEDSHNRNLSLQYISVTQVISVTAPDGDDAYFVAPDRFLGDQRASYNQDLEFKLRIGRSGPIPGIADVILEGARRAISQTIFDQGNPLPTTSVQTYKFRLHENSDYRWQPKLTARDFMSLLSNLTAIKIRGTYHPQGQGFLDEVRLNSARRGAAGVPVSWIEMCQCPTGYVGQFCESCAPGSRHDPPSGGPFSPCVPCNCNNHADICDANTGRCICQHNTGGDNCERCSKGYYGNALQGTSDDCKPCPCPNQGACIQLIDETVVCLECPKGYSGPRCDLCSDGFYGDPTGRDGTVRICSPCDCNSNVDPNAVGNCNRTTGECLKCIYNTGGTQCDQCLPEGDWKVNNFNVRQSDDKDVILNWSPVVNHDECLQSYKILVNDSERFLIQEIDVPQKTFQYRMSTNKNVTLLPNTDYFFTLIVTGKTANLTDTSTKQFTTSAACTVQAFRITDNKGTELQLAWIKPIENVKCLTSYRLSWYTLPDDTLVKSEVIKNNETNYFTIKNIDKCKNYLFTIISYAGVIGTSHTKHLITTPQDYFEPLVGKTVQVEKTWALLEWQVRLPTNGRDLCPITLFEMNCNQVDGPKMSWNVTTTDNDSTGNVGIKASELKPSTFYFCSLKVTNRAGMSKTSEQVVPFKTLQAEYEESSYNDMYNCNTTYPTTMINMFRFFSFCIIDKT